MGGRHQSRPVAGAAGDAMDVHGLKGFGEGHGWQDGGEPPGQHPSEVPTLIGRSLLHYWPLAWKHRYIRLICAACYALGGAGAV